MRSIHEVRRTGARKFGTALVSDYQSFVDVIGANDFLFETLEDIAPEDSERGRLRTAQLVTDTQAGRCECSDVSLVVHGEQTANRPHTA
jgi:hypothetical protein